jgi:hypothetical protein
VNVKLTMTVKALTRGLAPELLWKPARQLRRGCPENIYVDAPPGVVTGTPAVPTASAAPARPSKPVGPAVPEAVPVAPVETAPLSPPDKPKIIPIPAR